MSVSESGLGGNSGHQTDLCVFVQGLLIRNGPLRMFCYPDVIKEPTPTEANNMEGKNGEHPLRTISQSTVLQSSMNGNGENTGIYFPEVLVIPTKTSLTKGTGMLSKTQFLSFNKYIFVVVG